MMGSFRPRVLRLAATASGVYDWFSTALAEGVGPVPSWMIGSMPTIDGVAVMVLMNAHTVPNGLSGQRSDSAQRCMPQRRTVARSMVRKITLSHEQAQPEDGEQAGEDVGNLVAGCDFRKCTSPGRRRPS